MSTEISDDTLIKYISLNDGVTVSDIFKGLSKNGSAISLNSLRRRLRELHRGKKVMRTGVHTFKYKIRK